MDVWAISDLHLSIGLDKVREKPMDIFDDMWHEHWHKIELQWKEQIAKEDVILLPGDLSWANRLDEAMPALEWLDNLPGKKILVRGNHDNWWPGISTLRKKLPHSIFALQNNAICIGDLAIAGARGWTYQILEDVEHRDKMIRRELQRAERSLALLPKESRYKLFMMHFPPYINSTPDEEGPFMELLLQSDIDTVIYGHLHGDRAETHQNMVFENKKFILVSADKLAFSPIKIYNEIINDDQVRYIE